MCGIVGVWHLNRRSIDSLEFDRFTDALAHRGPDGRGTFIDVEAHLGLGHRRLAILELSDKGKQPMSYCNGRYWITFNGEIYNFVELRKILETFGYEFKSQSDTEVVLSAFQQWGTDCQFKFNGMWSFAIWDREKRELFLSRDRFGIKPLHYVYNGEYFAFASEMKAFCRLSWFNGEYDPEVLSRALDRPSGLEGTDACLLKGVTRLRGGYCLHLKQDKSLKIRRWWNTLEHLTDVPHRFSKQVSHFRDLFFDACSIRMRSDVPLGTALSGGLDSGSVLCTMAALKHRGMDRERHNPDWQRAFVASYPDTSQDEKYFAEEIIRDVSGIGIFKSIEPVNIINDMDKIIYHAEDLYPDILFGPWTIYKAMRQDRVFVSLDGHGGDELLGGYPRHCRWAMRDTLWPWPHPLRLHSLRSILRTMHAKGTVVTMPGLKFLLKRRLFKAKPEPFDDLVADQPLMKNFDSLTKGLYTDFHFTSLPTILRNFDRISMAHGVEVRTPFMDWRLVSFLFSLPSKSKVGGGFTKRILREAMKGILPEIVRCRTLKIGFAGPHEWVKGPLKPFYFDHINSRDFLESPYWDGPGIRDSAEKAVANGNWSQVIGIVKYIQAMRFIKLVNRSVHRSI